MSDGKLNIEKTQRKLFLDTCKTLGLNPDDLSPAQRLRVDRASALRLEIDDMQAAQLGGRTIDIRRLIEASEALERLVNCTPNGDGGASNELHAAKAQFEATLNAAVGARDYEENHENAKLRQENMELREENARLQAQLKELSAAKPLPTPTSNVVPMSGAERANNTKPPAHYLKQPEPGFYHGHR
jgi:hypothetical protein